LANSDVLRLANGPKQPIFSVSTCWVGGFATPGFNTLGKLLVNQADGGGVAVWAPSGLSLNGPAVTLDGLVFQAMFGGTPQRAGDAIGQALRAYSTTSNPRFIADIYQFLGDPALALKKH
jgi:hypothetical protein